MSTITAPDRSLEQRLTALEHANRVRSDRAQLKRDIKHGYTNGVALVREPPACIETMKVWDLLLALPKFGRVKVNKTLTRARISPSKTVGGLSDRQRREIIALLARRH